MIGRFAGAALMKRMPAPKLLSVFAAGALVCGIVAVVTTGVAPLWAIVLIGFFNSIMFPTIFLSLKHLGSYTKLGSSLLVMFIVGGAVFAAIMGRISDLSSIQRAFLVPLICYAYVLYFALWATSRTRWWVLPKPQYPARSDEQTVLSNPRFER